MHENPEAWGQLLFQPKLDDRARGYRTLADQLFGEIIRYAILCDEASVADVSSLYQRALDQGMSVETRRQIYQETVTAQQREPTAVSFNAYLPFIFCDTADGIVGSATIDYVSLAELIDGDPMTRVKEVVGFVGHRSIKNCGAAFGALLFMGDIRVSRLLRTLRDRLASDEVSIAMRGCTGQISAASVEFLIDWLEGMDADNADFGTVASGLVNVRTRLRSPLVMTQGCSTLSTDAPLGYCIESGERSGVSVLAERSGLITAQYVVAEAADPGEHTWVMTDARLILLEGNVAGVM